MNGLFDLRSIIILGSESVGKSDGSGFNLGD